MTIETTEFVRKPVYVQAVRVTDENFEGVAKWCEGTISTNDALHPLKYIKVRVHHPLNTKQTQAYVGDWILYGDKGYKVYTDKSMQKQFDDVSNLMTRTYVGVEKETEKDPVVKGITPLHPDLVGKEEDSDLDGFVRALSGAPEKDSDLEQVRDQD